MGNLHEMFGEEEDLNLSPSHYQPRGDQQAFHSGVLQVDKGPD